MWWCGKATRITRAAHKKDQDTTRAPVSCSYKGGDAVIACTELGLQGTAWDPDPLSSFLHFFKRKPKRKKKFPERKPEEKAEVIGTSFHNNLVTGEHLPTKWKATSQYPLPSMITIQAFLCPIIYNLRLFLSSCFRSAFPSGPSSASASPSAGG